MEAGVGVGQGDSAQGQDGDFRLASLVEKVEAGGLRVFFFEDGGEDGEGCGVRGRLGYFFGRVTGDCDDWLAWRELECRSARPTVPDFSYLLRRDVIGAEVDSVGLDG